MAKRGELLVAILNNRRDLSLALDQHWYRIPVDNVAKWLKDRWPPVWLAFYQTKVFRRDAHSINYYARVRRIREVYRWQLFPEDPRDAKSEQRYYQIAFDGLRRLTTPIVSRRWRRIIFIPTTWQKFKAATEVNDLYDESPLEDLLWDELRRLRIHAERQEFIKIGKRSYSLDFAVYCETGKLAIETDGDTWHANAEKAVHDNIRDNDLETAGWRLLRFNTQQINEGMAEYCIPVIAKAVNSMGGLDEGSILSRKIDLNEREGTYQLGLFDNL